MSQPVSRMAIPSVQSFCYFSLTLLAWCALMWIGLILGHYFANIVMLIGLVVLFVYLLLAPVNIIHRLLLKPAVYIYQRVPLQKWVSQGFIEHASRAVAIMIVYLVFFLFVSVLSIRFLPIAVEQLGAFMTNVPSYLESVEDWLTEQPWLNSILSADTPTVSPSASPTAVTVTVKSPDATGNAKTVTTTVPTAHTAPTKKGHKLDKGSAPREVLKKNIEATNAKLQGFVVSHINDGLSNIVGFLGTTLTGVVYGLTALVLTFYCLLDGRKLRDGFLSMLVDESHRETADFIMLHFHRLMFAFVKSQLILGIFTGAFMIVVYSFFGVPYAFFLGAFFAIAEIIPVVGTWIGFTPGILVLLFMDPIKLLIVMAICYLFQTVKDNIVAPQVVGDALGVHPVIVILSLLICAQVGGLLGIVFAIPLASLLNVLIEYGKEKAKMAAEAPAA